MIQVQYMKPFHTKVKGNKLRLVFAYQYFTVMKEGELFHFIPIEGKEMIINMDTGQIENMSEVFVFQKGNRFIRMPLYQLMLISNIHEHLEPILKSCSPRRTDHSEVTYTEVCAIVQALEEKNYEYLIDQALLNKDEELFYKLIREGRGVV
ncbi:transcriptional regulator [Lysinibacillus phage vB_LfM_LysYB1]|nr:transcriptional regulator [Lysinibacillus phage vB_LfM_LysYB1]